MFISFKTGAVRLPRLQKLPTATVHGTNEAAPHWSHQPAKRAGLDPVRQSVSTDANVDPNPFESIMFAAALIYILAVMSPGPNFLLVSRFAASSSIRAGLGASLGIVVVGLMFSISSVTGLALLMARYPEFNEIATWLGACYLTYIAYQLARSAIRPAASDQQSSTATLITGFWRAWWIGVLTNITNMKTIAFMISIFAGFMATDRTLVEKSTVIAICSTFEVLWYCGVAMVFGQGVVQRFYLRYNRQIDACMAVLLVLFAAQTVMAS